MGAKDDSLEIVRAIVTLAHTLELNVTAEGVETVEQLSQLREMECEYGQGYFFAKPLTQETAKELIVKTQQLTTDFNYFASSFAKPQ
jgi:EAL domain-containing protein (putative c-di-GMP-specific phosphodiesterase class I)